MVQRDFTRHAAMRAGMPVIMVLGLCGVAHAQVQWQGSLGITSDYVQAGLSQTRGKPALQGGARIDVDQRWSVGVWASQIDRAPGPGATYEIDAYLARAWQLSPDWFASLTATHYFYPNDTAALRYDYDDVTATLGYRARYFASVVWSPNTSDGGRAWHARRKQTWAYELTASQPLLRTWTANAGIGWRDMHALFGDSYWYGQIGLSYVAGPTSWHLTYMRTDETARYHYGHDRAAANTLVGSVIWRIGTD